MERRLVQRHSASDNACAKVQMFFNMTVYTDDNTVFNIVSGRMLIKSLEFGL